MIALMKFLDIPLKVFEIFIGNSSISDTFKWVKKSLKSFNSKKLYLLEDGKEYLV